MLRRSSENPQGNLTTDKQDFAHAAAAPIGVQPQLGGRPPKKPERALLTATRSPTSTARSARSAPPSPDRGEPMSDGPRRASRWRHFRASLSRQSRGRGKDTIAIAVLDRWRRS